MFFDNSYSSENRLVSSSAVSSNSQYTYGPFGRRLSKTVDGTTTRYLYDGDQVLAETDDTGTTLATYIYGPGIDEPLTMTRGSTTYTYHFDGLGSVVSLTDDAGSLVESYSYDVYGSPSTTSSVGNPYLFTGRRFDPETDLYYYRARYYDPVIGRFLQRDSVHLPSQVLILDLLPEWALSDCIIDSPIILSEGPRQPQSFHPYLYVLNNPLSLVDPLGLYDSRVPFENKVIEGVINKKLKETFPTMPDDARKKTARALREEMTADELSRLKNKNIPDSEKGKIVKDIAKRAQDDPKNAGLKEEVEPYLPESWRKSDLKQKCNSASSQ